MSSEIGQFGMIINKPSKRLPQNRRGCPKTVIQVPLENYVSILPIIPPPVVYWSAKLKHSGITIFKRFENCHRSMKRSSLRNLLQLQEFNAELAGENYVPPVTRTLSEAQSRKCKGYCSKLAFYSATRVFNSKKSGRYAMRVAFLTLTTPESVTDDQALKAFDKFLDYLRRTANCVYVWKKELGEKNKKLHFHVLINNFIPFYIIAWKWKRLLIGEGCIWPLNEKGEATTSHYRIEVPRSKKQIAHYVSKYMSKAYALPRKLGYVFGHSAVLDDCKEIELMEKEVPWNEVEALCGLAKVISGDHVTHVCCNLSHIDKAAPGISALFKDQYLRFCELLTMPQKFNYV